MKIKLLMFLSVISCIYLNSGYSASLSIYEENDVLEPDGKGSNVDGYYTQGLQFKYENDNNWGIKLAQQIYTPENKDDPNPQYGDRPYAGWLHSEFFKKTYKENYENYYEIGLGIVGPYSLAEEAQIEIHKLIGSHPPMGWKYQLNNEPTLQLAYYRTYSLFVNKYIEFRPYAGANLGNALTDVELGNIIRVGYNLPKNFDPVIKAFKLENKSFLDNIYAYGFLGGKAYGVARNIFLDGNTFSDNIVTVDKENVVGDGLIGLCIGIYNFEVTATHVERTDEFKTQIRPEKFDSLQIHYKF
jgi:hypothetical protein